MTDTTDAVKTARDAATAAAQALQLAEARCKEGRHNLEYAERRAENARAKLDKLRQKAAALAADGRFDEAQKLSGQIAEQKAEIEVANEAAQSYRGVIDRLEMDVARADDEAQRLHRAAHRAATDEARPALIAIIQSEFRRAWRQYQAAGQVISFDGWCKNLLSDAHVLGNHNFSAECDLGHPEAPPRAECLSFIRRRELLALIEENR